MTGNLWQAVTRHFRRGQGGNVTVIFSLSLMVMAGIAGAAIDYIRLVDQRTVFNAAADAAVLAAISSAREAERNGLNGIPALAKKAAQAAWDRNIRTATLSGAKSPKIDVSKANNAWTATVTYDDQTPTTFASLLGIKEMRLAGTSTASTTVEKNPNFWDFHIVIDTSSSMGIGATQSDMTAMVADPSIGCAFACHWANYALGETDSVTIAAKKNYKLRVDVVDDAVDGMVQQLQIASTGGNIRAKLWGMNDTVGTLVDLTAKLADIKNHKIELYRTPVSVGNTNYAASFNKMTTEVDKAGDGKSAVSPKKAVFIVTDGIHDTGFGTSNVSYNWYSDHQMGTVDPAFCQTMKDRNVLVGVLFIDYITPSGFEGAMNNVTPSVLPALKACATDGLFFNATSPDGIKQAMQDMLAAAMGLGAVRLTQ